MNPKTYPKEVKNIYNLSKMNEYEFKFLKVLTKGKNNNLPKFLLDCPEFKGKVFDAKDL